jgi:hypothetical protein
LLRSESVILLVNSLYAEATEAEELRAALSSSNPDIISILGDIILIQRQGFETDPSL